MAPDDPQVKAAASDRMRQPPDRPAGAPDRRVRPGLRALVDEMLNQIRTAARHEDAWQPEERRRAEEDLARIMEQVRAEAMVKDAATKTQDPDQEPS